MKARETKQNRPKGGPSEEDSNTVEIDMDSQVSSQVLLKIDEETGGTAPKGDRKSLRSQKSTPMNSPNVRKSARSSKKNTPQVMETTKASAANEPSGASPGSPGSDKENNSG